MWTGKVHIKDYRFAAHLLVIEVEYFHDFPDGFSLWNYWHRRAVLRVNLMKFGFESLADARQSGWFSLEVHGDDDLS